MEVKTDARKERKELMSNYYKKKNEDVFEYDFKQDLPSLLKEHFANQKEIQGLDASLKEKGYLNYKKLQEIKTKTRQFKKQNPLELLTKLETIKQNLQNLTAILDPKRNQLQHLGDIHYLVKKLNQIIAFPAHFKDLIAQKRYPQAAIFYSKALSLLKNYSDMQMLNTIQQDLNNINLNLHKKISERLGGKLQMQQLCESIGILLLLSKQHPDAKDTESPSTQKADAIKAEIQKAEDLKLQQDLQKIFVSKSSLILEEIVNTGLLSGMNAKDTHTLYDSSLDHDNQLACDSSPDHGDKPAYDSSPGHDNSLDNDNENESPKIQSHLKSGNNLKKTASVLSLKIDKNTFKFKENANSPFKNDFLDDIEDLESAPQIKAETQTDTPYQNQEPFAMYF
jgi:hypothetical protein